MKKYYVHCSTDMNGTDTFDLIEAETLEAAEVLAQEMAYENYSSYDWEQQQSEDEDAGFEYLEGEHYNYDVEEYDPKKHNSSLWATDPLYEEESEEENKND